MDNNTTFGVVVVDPIGLVKVNGSEGQGNVTWGPTSMGPALYQYAYVTLFNALLFIVGVSGNILVIQVVVRIRSMWKRMNFFLVSLSCADLQLLIVGLPVAVLEFYSKERWYIGEAMCRLVPFLENASHHCSVMTLLVIGFERYYAICHPLRETSRSACMSPSLLIPLTWALSCVVALPMALLWRIQHATFYDGSEVELCTIDSNIPFLKAYILFIFIVFLVIPLLLLTAMYSSIILTLENSTKNCTVQHHHLSSSVNTKSSSNPNLNATTNTTTTASNLNSNSNSTPTPTANGHSSSILPSDRRRFRSKDTIEQHNMRIIACRRQVIRMMVAVMALYFLCIVPMRAYQIWIFLAPTEDINSLDLEGQINLIYIVRMLIFLNCAGNPIIYGLVSANFRNAFKQSIACRNFDRTEGHRYNAVFYNSHLANRRSTNNNNHHGVIGTPTERSPCRQHRGSCTVSHHVMSGVLVDQDHNSATMRGSRQSIDSKKSDHVTLRDGSHHVMGKADEAMNGVMATEVVIELYDKAYSNKTNGSSTYNNTDTRTFV